MSLGRNSIESHRLYSKTIPNCVLAKIQLHLVEIILRQFQSVSWPKIQCISSKSFEDNSKLCFSQTSIAFRWNYSMTIPNCFLAGTPSHLIEIILTQFQIFSRSKFPWIPSIIFYDNSKLCFSQNSIASRRSYSKTIPYCVLAEIQLHLVEIILRQSQIFSWPKFRCIPSKTF